MGAHKTLLVPSRSEEVVSFGPSFGDASKARNPGRNGRASTVRSCLTSFYGTGL